MNYWAPMLIANLWLILSFSIESVPQSLIAILFAAAWMLLAWFGGKNA